MIVWFPTTELGGGKIVNHLFISTVPFLFCHSPFICFINLSCETWLYVVLWYFNTTIRPFLLISTGFKSYQCCRVRHCGSSFGVFQIRMQDMWPLCETISSSFLKKLTCWRCFHQQGPNWNWILSLFVRYCCVLSSYSTQKAEAS